MSSESETGQKSRGYDKVGPFRESADAAVAKYLNESNSGNVSFDVKKDLATAAQGLYYALYEYRNDEALTESWEDRDIDWVVEIANSKIEGEESRGRSNGATRKTEIPAIAALDSQELFEAILEMNDIANELGFSRESRLPEETDPHRI